MQQFILGPAVHTIRQGFIKSRSGVDKTRTSQAALPVALCAMALTSPIWASAPAIGRLPVLEVHQWSTQSPLSARGAFGAGHYSTSVCSTALGYGNVVLICKVAAAS